MTSPNPFVDEAGYLHVALSEYTAMLKELESIRAELQTLAQSASESPANRAAAQQAIFGLFVKQVQIMQSLPSQHQKITSSWQFAYNSLNATEAEQRRVKEDAERKAAADAKAKADKIAAEKAEASRIRQLLAQHPAIG